MGIIKAGVEAVRGAAADQWKEVFRAGEMGSDTLLTRAVRMGGQHSANEGSKDIISDGSVIIVGEGECAVITENGQIVGVYDQPGEQIFRSNQSRGVFGGGVSAFLKDVGRRFSFGGEAPLLQRMYYVNTKELSGGSIRAEGVPLRCRDPLSGMDLDGGVSLYGSYTFRIVDPALFCRAAIRAADARSRRLLLQQMDGEVQAALGPALAQLTEKGIRPSELPAHTVELCDTLRRLMSDKWSGLRGIEVFDMMLESVRVLDQAELREMQRVSALKDPSLAQAHITGAKAEALRMAAANKAGAAVLVAAVMGKAPAGRDWRCSCGSRNEGLFCTECGAKRPEEPLPSRCTQCGWKPGAGQALPNFCPECGAALKGAAAPGP